MSHSYFGARDSDTGPFAYTLTHCAISSVLKLLLIKYLVTEMRNVPNTKYWCHEARVRDLPILAAALWARLWENGSLERQARKTLEHHTRT